LTEPVVSLVMPSYNQAGYLAEAIDSVLAQDYPHVELLVVDDGSTDGSIDVARSYGSRLAYFATREHAGQVAALAHGFEHARGDLLGWLNSDDVLFPDAISRAAGELRRDPRLLLVYGDNVFIDEESREVAPLPAREWDPRAMVRSCDNHVPQPGVLFRREALERAPLREGYYLFDFELWLRMSAHGAAKRLRPPPLAGYRIHSESKTAVAPLPKARDYVRFADEFLSGPSLPAYLRPYAAAGRRNGYRRAAVYFYDGGDLRRARRYALRSRNWPILVRAVLPARIRALSRSGRA
jgi:glycosyltransferase involved in cell wall biosynthesis